MVGARKQHCTADDPGDHHALWAGEGREQQTTTAEPCVPRTEGCEKARAKVSRADDPTREEVGLHPRRRPRGKGAGAREGEARHDGEARSPSEQASKVVDERHHGNARDNAQPLARCREIGTNGENARRDQEPEKVRIPLNRRFAHVPHKPISSEKVLRVTKRDERVFGDAREIHAVRDEEECGESAECRGTRIESKALRK